MRLSPVRPLLVAGGLLVLTNGVVFYVANRVLDNGMSWEEPFTRGVFGTVALVAVAAVVLDRYRMDEARLRRPSLFPAVMIGFFSMWIMASSLWSLTPEITRGRGLIYVGLAAFAWVIADLEFEAFRRALLLASGVAVGASLLAVVVSDSIGLDRNDDWRGIFTNRNSLAPVAVVAILLAASLAFDRPARRRLAPCALVVAATIALLGSGSRTAWLGLGAAAGIAALVVFARIGVERHGARAARVAVGVGTLGALAAAAVISRMWGESTFAQRRTIWDLVWDRIADRPLQGYGWFNVWGDPGFVSAHELLGRGSAHNSFLEVWLGLGIIGLVPFVIIVGAALWGVVRSAWNRPSVETATWLALVVFLVIENLTESFVLWFSYNWVLLMAAALRAGAGRRSPAESRTPAPSEPVNG